MTKMYKLLLLITLFAGFSAYSQTPAKVTIKGTIIDTTSGPMSSATVMLLQPKDSALINFARANDKGEFVFKNIKNQTYIFKVSYTAYLPHSELVGPFEVAEKDLGNVRIKPISKELMEVVVKTARAPLTIKGDTIEYDARSFKVPEGSTVEDLLRRLPGMQVDADGNIKAQGKDVKKVLVDGKTFFGDDPKMATKNLGAETISKVQVFNDKSEAAKISGIDDGKKEKTINLELKEEFKNGKFGKITAGVGDMDRWVGSGNYNKFNKNEQFSVIGYGNNINKTGVNWSDYGEFKGNNSFNDFDNGDFGFGGGGGMRYFYQNGDDIPTNNFDGRGFTKNGGIGVNYNFDNKKTKFSSNYFYNQTKLDLSTISKTQTFQNNNSFFSNDTTSMADFRSNHNIGARFEKMIDSSSTLVVKGNFKISKNDVNQNTINGFSKTENKLETQQELSNFLGKDILKFNVNSIYKHKFKNKARSFSISAGLSQLNNDGSDLLNAVNKFFTAKNVNEQIRATNLINTTEINSNQIKASLLYVEPLSKNLFLETFYNVSSDNYKTFRNSKNKADDRRLDSLSNYYTSNVLYNRIGTDLRYSKEGKNFAVGIAGLSYNLSGDVYLDRTSNKVLNKIDKTYSGITPYLSTTIEFKNNMYTDLSYTYNFSAPQINDLQPIVNNTNPFYITKGNPNLSPEKSHNINFSINKFDPSSFAYINFWSSFNFYDSQVVYNQTISDNFVTTSSPVNLGGGYNHNIGIYTGFPIIKTKLTFNANANLNNGESLSFINNVLNKTNSKDRSIGFSLNATPSTKFFVDADVSFNRNNIAYSIQKSQDQLIKNTSLSVSVKWNLIKKTFLETNYAYTAFVNERFNFDRKVPIWNASVRRLFLKENKLEMRLAAFDLLNKKIGINQFASTNFVSTSIAPTLARYFMLSLTYNLRGHEDKLKKNGWN